MTWNQPLPNSQTSERESKNSKVNCPPGNVATAGRVHSSCELPTFCRGFLQSCRRPLSFPPRMYMYIYIYEYWYLYFKTHMYVCMISRHICMYVCRLVARRQLHVVGLRKRVCAHLFPRHVRVHIYIYKYWCVYI